MRRCARVVAVTVVMALTLPVSACASSAEKCEEAFAAAATAVPGVISATWDCNNGFGGGWQRGDVRIAAGDKGKAIAVMREVLRAFAASPDLEDGWATPQKYTNNDGTIVVGANDLGFNGVPNVGQVRERYGVG
ncbi:hypothetical protein ACFQ68_30955 [Amycolatopsis japonica]|uniref:hypothetical protein n=1 Tax=Amycolatopsis japonica TaxID=208439 RepID=UPI0036707108